MSARHTLAGRIRLAAKDIALSRRRPGVRIPYALPLSFPEAKISVLCQVFAALSTTCQPPAFPAKISVSEKTLMRWREGKSQPRPRKGNEVIKDTFPDLEGKLPNKIVEGIKAEKRIITALMGVVAKDKGLSERAHYSLLSDLLALPRSVAR